TAVRLLLDWRIEGPAAIFLHGLEKGYYKQEGLDVAVEPGTGSRDASAKLASGAHDIGFGDITSLIRFRDENPASDLKAVMIIYDRPAAAIIGRRSRGIGPDIASLTGKKIGAPAGDGAFAQWPVFRSVNKIADGAVKIETVGFPVREPMLASGEVDAVFGFAHTTPISLKARNVPADDLIVLMMADYGLAAYGNGLIVNPKFAADQPEAVRGFVRATLRSLSDAVAEPEVAVEAALRRGENLQRPVELERLRLVIEQSIVTPYTRANGFGGIDTERWRTAIDQMDQAAKFRDRTRAADAFTDVFLPRPAERQRPPGG
ncbi:MAG: ABC transporter substrate-binding protein, partial [Beijerinckiaceae bacterium]